MRRCRGPHVVFLLALGLSISNILWSQSGRRLWTDFPNYTEMLLDTTTSIPKTIRERRPTYASLHNEISAMVGNASSNFQTAYEQATILDHPNETKTICREKCCAERIWIGLSQDEHKPINWWSDIHDLSDAMVQEFDSKLPLHATNLYSEDLLPCLVPNTIISVDNFAKSIGYFWQQLRPKIRVPFLLLTGGSDNDSPLQGKRQLSNVSGYLGDPLLVKWYGMNPRLYPNRTGSSEGQQKFVPMLSGLSYQHPQEKYLSSFLKLTNYANPFEQSRMRERYPSSITIDFDRDVMVHFGRRKNPTRQRLWNSLCPNTTTTLSSCNQNTNNLPLHKLYSDMTRQQSDGGGYRFGISPVGMGYDCYRHYELWYLGLIPVLWERDLESKILYQDLPAVRLKADQRLESRVDFIMAIQSYVTSSEFVEGIESGRFARGWNRLFLKDKRQNVLKDARREIFKNEHGKEFYAAYRYYLTKDGTSESIDLNHQGLFCHNAKENCAVSTMDSDALTAGWVGDPSHRFHQLDFDWIRQWE